MQRFKNMLPAFSIFVLTVGLALNFSGCTDDSPLTPQNPENSENLVQSKNGQINILNFGIKETSLKKVTTVSKWSTVQSGGFLFLHHTGNGISVNSALYILPGTMIKDAEVSLTLDDEQFKGSLDLVFSPHGTTFSQPALLTIVASGLDLSGYDPDEIDIYNDNPETGLWEKMRRDALEVDPNSGSIIIQNARLPHFSRYAIAAE